MIQTGAPETPAHPQDDGPGTELARFVEDVFANGDMGSGYFTRFGAPP